ncbi:type II toxin-antitoxin system HicA family toxin [Candidatus Daviesbacteria bacterium]|nr:type II toxin-antitoxin system HicA family toxin [Candidatus Daviesbacteria bacterium]
MALNWLLSVCGMRGRKCRLGFQTGKGKGSHVRLTHPKPVPEGTLRKIIKQAEITEEQLNDLK